MEEQAIGSSERPKRIFEDESQDDSGKVDLHGVNTGEPKTRRKTWTLPPCRGQCARICVGVSWSSATCVCQKRRLLQVGHGHKVP